MLQKEKLCFYFAEAKADFIFLQESHSGADDLQFWKNQWGNNIWSAHGNNHSVWVMVLKDNFRGKILHTNCDPKGHWVILFIEACNNIPILCNIYGYNSNTLNDNMLLDNIEENILSFIF